MLLHEIKREPIKRKGEHVPRFNPGDMPQRFQKVGGGIGAGILDSEIYLDKQHPNRILKMVMIRNMRDPYYRYIRMIEQHQNNPFFPRVYGIKVYDAPGYEAEYTAVPDHQVLYVWMEKLQPLSNFDPELVYQLLDNIGVRYRGAVSTETGDYSLRKQFERPAQRQRYAKLTPDPKFKEALRLLEPLFKNFRSDLHIENIMARAINHNLQLVITDPLYPDLGGYDY